MALETESSEPRTQEIRRQIDETRASLSEKLETLEGQVIGTVNNARETVEDAVEGVKATVDKVKETFDVELQTRRHPWLLFGGSVCCGFLAGNYLARPSSASESPGHFVPSQVAGPGFGQAHRNDFSGTASIAAPRESFLDRFGEEIDGLKALAIGTIFGIGRDILRETLPPSWVEPVSHMIDSATTKLGGQPLTGDGSQR